MTASAKQRLAHLTNRIVELRAEHDATKEQWEGRAYSNTDQETLLYDRYKSARDKLFACLFEYHETAKRELGIGEGR